MRTCDLTCPVCGAEEENIHHSSTGRPIGRPISSADQFICGDAGNNISWAVTWECIGGGFVSDVFVSGIGLLYTAVTTFGLRESRPQIGGCWSDLPTCSMSSADPSNCGGSCWLLLLSFSSNSRWLSEVVVVFCSYHLGSRDSLGCLSHLLYVCCWPTNRWWFW